MQLSYKYRILPTPTQAAALTTMLGDFCDLYNAELEQRINAYRPTASSRHEIVWGTYVDRRGIEREGYIRRHLANTPAINKPIRAYDQIRALTQIRQELPDLARWSCSAKQQVLRRLDKTFKAFFRRGHGFPRFRAKARFHAAEMRVGDGLTIKNNRIGIGPGAA